MDTLSNVAGLSKQEKVEILRSRMEAMSTNAVVDISPVSPLRSTSAGLPSSGASSLAQSHEVGIECANSSAGVPVPPALGTLLKNGGLPRAGVTLMDECPTLLIELIAHATAQGEYVAAVGCEDLHWAAVADAGGDLTKLTVISTPPAGESAVNSLDILGVLCEGMDLVVCRNRSGATLTMSPSQTRPIQARLRNSRCSLLVCGYSWPSAALSINARIAEIHGLGKGRGRIRGSTLDVRIMGKGQPPVRTQWRTGEPEIPLHLMGATG